MGFGGGSGGGVCRLWLLVDSGLGTVSQKVHPRFAVLSQEMGGNNTL